MRRYFKFYAYECKNVLTDSSVKIYSKKLQSNLKRQTIWRMNSHEMEYTPRQISMMELFVKIYFPFSQT